MERHPDVELLASETAFRGPIFDVVLESVRLPSGLRQDLAVVDHRGAVCVAPVLADGRILCVRQYRHATGEWLVELPAGRLEADEDPLAAARRELEEETGFRAGRFGPPREFYPAPGFCSERMTLFAAFDLEPVAGGGLACDADEELAVARLSAAELLDSARDAKTLVAAGLLLAGRLT